jgi:putative ABC transport system permease protein
LPAGTIDDVRAAGVDPQLVVGAAGTLNVRTPTGSSEVLLLAPSAGALTVAHDRPALTDDTMIVPPWWTEPAGALSVGSTVTVTVAGRSARFTVSAGHLADAGGSATVIVSQRALHRLAPRAATVALWAALPATADAGAVTAALQRATASQPDVEVTGSAQERASTAATLGTLVTLATALLAVAVLIAIVGIGNTLGLSVLERTRESALLRTLGLQRRQLRQMVAVEAVLLAAVGAVAGIVLGVGYGIAGSLATVGSAGRAAVIALPWGQIALVLAVALVAGLVAAVLPAAKAARVVPAAALAEA